jgi:peptide/nickel transport system substrate-binding protein
MILLNSLSMIAITVVIVGCTSTSLPQEPPEAVIEPPPQQRQAQSTTVITPTLASTSQTFNPSSRVPLSRTLRLIYYEAPTILNVYLSSGNKDFEASRIVYEPLASLNREGTLVPILAEEIPTLENGGVSKDYTAVTWKLKPDLQWSDGTDVTADDILFTYDYITNPDVNSTFTFLYETVSQVEKIDDTTVTVHFSHPNPAWDVPFVGYGGSIIPHHIFEPYNGKNRYDAPANMAPVGTGPYQVVSFTTDQTLFLSGQPVETKKIVYIPNPYYRNPEKLAFDRIELIGGGAPEQATRALFEEGSADYVYNLQLLADDLDHLTQHNEHGRILFNFGSQINLVNVNFTDPVKGSQPDFPHPILSDKRVRQALAYAMDRERIAKEAFGSAARPLYTMLVAPEKHTPVHRMYPYDLDKAATLLDEAGWHDTDADGIRDKDGTELRLHYLTYVSPRMQVIQNIITENFEAIGIDLDPEVVDASILFSSNPAKEMIVEKFPADLMVYDITMDSHDVSTYLSWWKCDQIPYTENNWSAGFNISRWCNPSYDTLYKQSLFEFDTQAQRELFIDMNNLLIEDVAVIPTAHIAILVGISHSLHGVELTPWDTDTWKIATWYKTP